MWTCFSHIHVCESGHYTMQHRATCTFTSKVHVHYTYTSPMMSKCNCQTTVCTYDPPKYTLGSV